MNNKTAIILILSAFTLGGFIGAAYTKQPWMFGHGETKATCLWLKNLPKLESTNVVDGREQRLHLLPPSIDRAKIRSKTFQGIADAMARQWGAEC